jgi:preprotein translocase subunit SecD
MLIWVLFELILILGAASLIHWTIDLASIAGIIAALGTGVDVQIMVLDEILLGTRERVYTLKQRVKRAFFIIFSAAFTTIAAMIPLMIIGIGVMRGFAITTTLGILIGVFITRPAFGKVAEKILEKKAGSGI